MDRGDQGGHPNEAEGPENLTPFWIIFATVLGFLGLISFLRRKRVTTYRLFLVVSSAEAAAFETKDQSEITQLRGALERAMVAA